MRQTFQRYRQRGWQGQCRIAAVEFGARVPLNAPALGFTHHDGIGEALALLGETQLQPQGLHTFLRLQALHAQRVQARMFVIQLIDTDPEQAPLADRQPAAEGGIAVVHRALPVQPQNRGGKLIEGGGIARAHCTILVQYTPFVRTPKRKLNNSCSFSTT